MFIAYDLGLLPIANELYLVSQTGYEEFPLCLSICRNCTLGQVQDVVTPERLFEDYRYTSSTSETFLRHASDFVAEVVGQFNISSEDWVLEIASNDGYLLRNFLPLGIKVLGIEPSVNVGNIAANLGIDTISDFFTSQVARQILEIHGYPKLIIANNVLAHVPDIRDFMQGLSILCGSETVISIENPSLLNILKLNQFDSIYHEHYSYLTANSVSLLARNFGLSLFDVQEIATHGGSNRYWVDLNSSPSQEVGDLMRKEIESGITDSARWSDSYTQVRRTLERFTKWVDERVLSGGRVAGYGAAAKASTLLNLANIGPGNIALIADKSTEKQGRFMPSYSIPIVDLDELVSYNPTDIVIFPWNIATEIESSLSITNSEANYWIAIPEMMKIR
jgi:hypothetical protein